MLFSGLSLPQLLLYIAIFMFSITIHEVAHGYMAYRLGDSTAKYMGRITMNPLAHFDLFGAILLLVAGFGFAKPVPVDSRYFKKPARDMAFVSLAGPLSNILLAFISLLLADKLILPILSAVKAPANVFGVIVMFFEALASLNIILAVFNLLPIPPLDGSKILLVFAPYKWRNFIFSIERYGIIILYFLLTAISPFIVMVQETIYIGMLFIINRLPF